MRRNISPIILITVVYFLSFAATMGQPVPEELNKILLNPPEKIQQAISEIRSKTQGAETSGLLSILATRLWEERRFEDARNTGNAAIEALDQLLARDLNQKAKAALLFEQAKLYRDIFQNRDAFDQKLKAALQEDAANARYQLAEKQLQKSNRPQE